MNRVKIDRSRQEREALDYLAVVQRMPCRPCEAFEPFGEYHLVITAGGLGFSHEKRLIAACGLRVSDDGVWQFEMLAVDAGHRGRRLGHFLLWVSTVMVLLGPDAEPRVSISSMPDGEPEFVRELLLLLGCEETTGVNTDGLPILYYQHPDFVGDFAWTRKDYREEQPEDSQGERKLRAFPMGESLRGCDPSVFFSKPRARRLFMWALGRATTGAPPAPR